MCSPEVLSVTKIQEKMALINSTVQLSMYPQLGANESVEVMAARHCCDGDGRIFL